MFVSFYNVRFIRRDLPNEQHRERLHIVRRSLCNRVSSGSIGTKFRSVVASTGGEESVGS